MLGDEELRGSEAVPAAATTIRWLLDRFPHRPVLEVVGVVEDTASLEVFGALPMGLSVNRLIATLPCDVAIQIQTTLVF